MLSLPIVPQLSRPRFSDQQSENIAASESFGENLNIEKHVKHYEQMC